MPAPPAAARGAERQGPVYGTSGLCIEIFQTMPPPPVSPPAPRPPLPRKHPPPDRRPPPVGILPNLPLELLLDRLGGADGAPFALSEVGPAVFPEADNVDLGGFGPVGSGLEGGGHAFLFIEPGEGFAAEALEALAEVGVQVGADEVAVGAGGTHVADGAGVREDEAEPETQERVREVVADGAGGRGLARQGVAPFDVAELHELLEVVGEVPRVRAGLPGDLLERSVAGGERGQDGVVEGDLAELFAEEEVGLAVQGSVFVQKLGGEVRLDRAVAGEALQVEGDPAAEEVGPRLVGPRVARVEEGRLPVAEGLQVNLCRPSAEEGAFAAQDLPLHEADVGAAEDEEDVSGAFPYAVPLLLEDGRQLGARLGGPLEFVEGQDELGAVPDAGGDGVERGAPAFRGEGGEERLFEHPGGLGQELANLHGGGSLFPEEVDPGPVFQEMEDELALADAAAAVDGDEGALRPLPGLAQDPQLCLPADEVRHAVLRIVES